MKKTLKILPVVLMVIMLFSNVFAANINDVDAVFNKGDANEQVETIAKNAWETVIVLVQILSIAAAVFAGLRYMLASASTRADIKKQLGILALGAILVFCAVTILQTVSTVGNQVLK